MKFVRLSLNGFKSFVDPTVLQIEPGLTGVVGPNGCGKSNLVEALRWVMGETSPKSMRGSGMEDVIFGGTAQRPARASAEVALMIENKDRSAPAAFNDTDELMVSRKIARDQGSLYRVNGKEARARDVQTLFADAGTGADSPALVRQGRISELINAKPKDRRAILEEAAGTAGLHARRHEAELRLRAAEANLLRLDDVMQQIELALASLKKQARQAARYRTISGQIRKSEAILSHLKWEQAKTIVKEAEARLETAQRHLAEATRLGAAADTFAAEMSQKLPPLRQAEAEAAAVLQRLNNAKETLDREEAQARQEAAALAQRIAQIGADGLRERANAADAEAALSRLSQESGGLEAQRTGEKAAEDEARARVEMLASQLQAEERALDELNQRIAALVAKRQGLEAELERAERAKARLDQDRANIAREMDALGGGDDRGQLDAALEAVRALEERVEAARTAVQAAETNRANAAREEQSRREALSGAEVRARRLKDEEATIQRLLDAEARKSGAGIVDQVTVAAGLEAALGAALGDELEAPADPTAAAHWTRLPDLSHVPPLPAGVEPLSGFVDAPPELSRRLALTGLVEPGEAQRLQASLVPGQRLVSRSGDLWRWDGFVSAAHAPSAAARRLAQRNRLKDLEAERRAAEEEAEGERRRHEAARAALTQAGEAEAESRRAYRRGEEELSQSRRQEAEIERRLNQIASRRTALEEAARRLDAEAETIAERTYTAEQGLLSLEPEDELRNAAANRRQAVDAGRAGLSDARAAFDLLRREAEARARRLVQIADEARAWQSRHKSALGQIETLEARRVEAEQALAIAQAVPERVDGQRRNLMSEISKAEMARQVAADELATAEMRLGEADKAARAATEVLAEAREERGRAEAALEGAGTRLQDVEQSVRETLECEPAEALARAELEPGETLPAADVLEPRLERLKKERESLGAVNLRADIETQEKEQELAGLQAEKTDLEAAIGKLRTAIASINREGRERLNAAFDKVANNFRRLFVHLFGGGEAELRLTDVEDPLEAGLEILASPPGKRLQTMSLLSGGEQTLTALALIFAVFLVNPAPICVLDEVDAPLDDANVERFCNLLDEMTRLTDTRFLIITHHGLTMARMDRLYGVTMAERGISQLVSVDLRKAEELRLVS